MPRRKKITFESKLDVSSRLMKMAQELEESQDRYDPDKWEEKDSWVALLGADEFLDMLVTVMPEDEILRYMAKAAEALLAYREEHLNNYLLD